MTLDDIFGINITLPDENIAALAKAHWDTVAKPIDSLGSFEEIVCDIVSVRGELCPNLTKKALIIMCADNGVVCEGVSQTDRSVTMDVAGLMAKNKSSVGVLTMGYPIDIIPVDIGIDSDKNVKGLLDRKVARGTGNIAIEPAMTGEQCLDAIKTGIELVAECDRKGYSIIATGEMGIGNTTTSTALLCALTHVSPSILTGKGAGLSDDALENKIRVIERALSRNGFDETGKSITPEFAFEALRSVGGLDIAGLTGVFIGGAVYHIPIVIDGLISAVAALTASKIVTGCEKYMIASHMGRETGSKTALERLGLRAVINADMALGEGSGAVMLFPLIDMAYSLYQKGTAFSETDIGQYERFGS